MNSPPHIRDGGECAQLLTSEVPRQVGTGAGGAIDQLGPEVAVVLREGMALERKGNLDAEATARIETRLEAILQAQMRAAQVALEAPSPVERKAAVDGVDRMRRVRSVALWIPFGVFVAVLAGLVLEMTIGQGFIWFGGATYEPLALKLFLLLLPLLAVLFYRRERSTHHLRNRYPTWLVRWVFMYPVMVLLGAGLVAFAPWGWAAALGWAWGASSRVEVRVVSVDAPSPGSRGCDQSAQLEFKGAMASICLEGRLGKQAPAAGDTVTVSGRVSRLGLYVEKLHSP
ncbi:hypothetical protein [Acidovorax sp. Root217]|uniref:hypothetical protein n=1 Tax=Acidovorax sp. Root217 TaxID=1736492 RepID=UPI00070C4F35|nr:hypothetical protein [Acidovorax sp. Root217]KRC20416.1 hypothetical protein ASE31_25935 [Acidovorax sp. Root217]